MKVTTNKSSKLKVMKTKDTKKKIGGGLWQEICELFSNPGGDGGASSSNNPEYSKPVR